MGHLVLSSTAGLGVSIIGSFLGCALFHECAECFFLIVRENFIQRHNNEPVSSLYIMLVVLDQCFSWS